MLVEGDELSDDRWRQRRGEDRGGRPVAGKDAGRDDLLGGALGTHLVGGLAEGERRSLGQVVGQEQLVDVHSPVLGGVSGVGHGDEVRGDELGALVNELVEGVLAVGARLAPEDLAGLGGHGAAVPAHGLAVGLHGELLEVGGEAVQVLGVGQDGVGAGLEEVDVPDVEQAHEHGDVLGRGLGGEVLVNGVEAGEEVGEVLRADGHGQDRADGGVHRVASTHPVPEAEGVGRVDAELGDLVQGGGDGHEVFGDGAVGLNALGLECGQEPVAGHAGVGEGLQGGESLGGDDEQGRLRVEVRNLLGAVGGVDVGDEAALKALLHVGLEGLIDHDGTEVGASDTDVDHRLDGLAGDAGPLP